MVELNKNQKEEVLKMYNQDGRGVRYISERLSISKNCVWNMTKGKDIGLNYTEYIARNKGFDTVGDYCKDLRAKRVDREQNRFWGRLIKRYLTQTGKSQSDFAREIGKSRQVVSFYVSRRVVPSNDVARAIFELIKTQGLENLLKNILIEEIDNQ